MFKRLAQTFVLLLFGFTLLGVSDPATRFDHLGHQLVCQCGCGQILVECNHVGCPVSPVMLAELHQQLATTLPDAGVLNFFIGKYGPIVLAAPIRGGFDNVAWIVPAVVVLLATFGVGMLIRFWHRRRILTTPDAFEDQTIPTSMQTRIRRETDFNSDENS